MKFVLIVAILGVAFSVANASARNFDDCNAESNGNTKLLEKMNSIPKNDMNKRLRSVIVAIDYQIEVFSKCIPDRGAEEQVRNFVAQRKSALATCRQISSFDNCLVSPF